MRAIGFFAFEADRDRGLPAAVQPLLTAAQLVVVSRFVPARPDHLGDAGGRHRELGGLRLRRRPARASPARSKAGRDAVRPFDRADRAVEPVPGGDGVAGGVDGELRRVRFQSGVEICSGAPQLPAAGIEATSATRPVPLRDQIAAKPPVASATIWGGSVTVAGAEIADSPAHDPPSGKMFDSTTEVAPLEDCQTAAAVPLGLIATSGASALRALLEIAIGAVQDRPRASRWQRSRGLPPTPWRQMTTASPASSIATAGVSTTAEPNSRATGPSQLPPAGR